MYIITQYPNRALWYHLTFEFFRVWSPDGQHGNFSLFWPSVTKVLFFGFQLHSHSLTNSVCPHNTTSEGSFVPAEQCLADITAQQTGTYFETIVGQVLRDIFLVTNLKTTWKRIGWSQHRLMLSQFWTFQRQTRVGWQYLQALNRARDRWAPVPTAARWKASVDLSRAPAKPNFLELAPSCVCFGPL